MFKHATLNRAYRLVWSELRNTWIAVAEFARTRGKRASGAVAIGAAIALGAASATAAGEPAPMALPTNGQVVAGQVGISSSGARMDVTQGSSSAIVKWDSFNIGSQAHVNFAQPDASSVILNRASGGAAIFGRITANGNVFIVDPGGILFAPGAQVDVGGLVASSLGILDANFLAGKYQFERVGAGGTVANQGRLTAANGGFVALIAPQVSNSGSITATAGSVGLAAGDSVNLDFDHDGLLSFQVNVAAAAARADNSGVIVADGGRVVMNAQAKDALLSTVLNNDGVIRARSLESRNGEIWLGGGSSGVVSVTGTLDASGTEAGQAGGTVKVLGDKVGLFAQAKIDVSGVGAGGTALVGGNFQGKGPEQSASMTYVGKDVSIKADAVGTGDGGKVIVWADDVTRYYGDISARGGAQSGDGGFVEISGKGSLAFDGSVTTSAPAPNGEQGTLLLDPTDLTISNTASGTGSLDTQFDTTTPGIIAFANGGAADSVSAGALELLAAGTDIDLQASNSITMAALTTAGKGGIDGELTLDQTGTIKFRTGAGGFSMAATDKINVTGTGTLLIDAIAATSGGTGDGSVSVGTVQTLGSVSLKGTTVTVNGNITTTDTDLTIGGNLVIAEAASPTLSTGAGTAGNILVTGTTNGTAGGAAESLTVLAGTGNVTFTGAAGLVDALASLTIDGGSVSLGPIGGAASGVTGNVLIASSGSVTLANSRIGGYLDISAAGDVTQTGLLSITGDLWVRTTSGNILLYDFVNVLGDTVSLIAPLAFGTAGAGSDVKLQANSIKVGTARPSNGSTAAADTGLQGARVTIKAPSGSAILADGTQGLITADEPLGTTAALTIEANGVIGDPATATPTTVGLWVQTDGLVVVDGNVLGDGTVMLFGDETHQPKYEFSGDPLHRSVKYNGVEATNAQLTGALDAAYLDIRNQTTEIRESGFAKENASKVLRRGVVTSAGPGQPAVDDSTGLAGMELCDGTYGNDALACQ